MFECKRIEHPISVRQAIRKDIGVDNPTGDEVLDLLLGKDIYTDTPYVVYKYKRTPKSTVMNRLNLIWVFPIMVLIVMPVQYILTGTTGVKKGTLFGRVIDKLISLDNH